MIHNELVEQCRVNNQTAQLKLYKQYCDGMFCVAMRFLKNEDDAEDVLQESFVKAFQKISQFKGEVTFGAWLKKIVVNKCIDYLKAKKEQMLPLDETYMQISGDDDWSVDDTISVDEVKSAMEKLPDKYKYVVQLFLVEGYDHSEISQILGIPENTCRTRLLRGKGHLKDILNKNNYGTGS